GELAAPHADDVEALQVPMLAVDEAIRDHITTNAGEPADHSLSADARKLMHGRETADIDVISDLAVPSERCRVGKDHVVADLAVVADMAVTHEEPAGTDACHPDILGGADVHRHTFTDRAAVTD